MWSGYKSPVVTVTKNSGVVISSSNYEAISTRDTINPKIGFKDNLTDRWSYALGMAYRPTPLKGDFSGSGNSIDTDALIFTSGIQYRIVIWSKDVHLGTSFEYHQLQTKNVTKTPNEESGSAGSKIGAPGYSIGGNVLAGSLGLKFNF